MTYFVWALRLRLHDGNDPRMWYPSRNACLLKLLSKIKEISKKTQANNSIPVSSVFMTLDLVPFRFISYHFTHHKFHTPQAPKDRITKISHVKRRTLYRINQTVVECHPWSISDLCRHLRLRHRNHSFIHSFIAWQSTKTFVVNHKDIGICRWVRSPTFIDPWWRRWRRSSVTFYLLFTSYSIFAVATSHYHRHTPTISLHGRRSTISLTNPKARQEIRSRSRTRIASFRKHYLYLR
jgi:hypothetical protein